MKNYHSRTGPFGVHSKCIRSIMEFQFVRLFTYLHTLGLGLFLWRHYVWTFFDTYRYPLTHYSCCGFKLWSAPHKFVGFSRPPFSNNNSEISPFKFKFYSVVVDAVIRPFRLVHRWKRFLCVEAGDSLMVTKEEANSSIPLSSKDFHLHNMPSQSGWLLFSSSLVHLNVHVWYSFHLPTDKRYGRRWPFFWKMGRKNQRKLWKWINKSLKENFSSSR